MSTTYPKDLTYSLSVEIISAITCCRRLLEDTETGRDAEGYQGGAQAGHAHTESFQLGFPSAAVNTAHDAPHLSHAWLPGAAPLMQSKKRERYRGEAHVTWNVPMLLVMAFSDEDPLETEKERFTGSLTKPSPVGSQFQAMVSACFRGRLQQ